MKYLLLGAGAYLLFALKVAAVYVDFTQYDLGPSETLNIEGVTIQVSGGSPASLATCTRNLGLGSALLGNATSIDRRQGFITEFGMTRGVGTWFEEAIRLSVDGTINSVTVLPYHTLVGSSEPLFIPFNISVWAPGDSYFEGAIGNNPTVFRPRPWMVSWMELGLSQDWGTLPWVAYSMDHPGEELTFEFGFSVIGLDYTPVPEPNPFAMGSLGSLLLFAFRYTHKSR